MSKSKDKYQRLLNELDRRKTWVKDYLQQDEYRKRFRPAHIHDAVYSYINMGGKSLRPAVLMLACGAVGGDEKIALPAAAAVEVYHTWTLVHDDVIDRDERRRGAPTVHTEFTERAKHDFGWEQSEAAHYGLTIAILAGDIQQAWSISLLNELYTKQGLDPALAIQLSQELLTYVESTLVEGETLDVQFCKDDIDKFNEAMIIDMLWRKTGVLYEFAGRAGAAIGLQDPDPQNPLVKAIATFCSKCGTAFQIQDDILGILGDEKRLGKPVGSDIREGKRTLLTYQALRSADAATNTRLQSILGNTAATTAEIQIAVDIMRELDVINYAYKIAQRYVDDALTALEIVPESDYKALLRLWADYLIQRDF